MSTSTVSVKGLRELQTFLNQLPAKLEANVLRSALRAGAREVQKEARRLVPVKSGRLRAGLKISTSSRRGRALAKVKATGKHAFLAPWLEYGTRPHVIKPGKRRRALAVNGRAVAAIDHPGAQPKPFMRPALDARAQAAVLAVGNAIKKRLSVKHGLDTSGVDLQAGDAD